MSPVVRIARHGAEPILVVVDRRLQVGRECEGFLVDDPAVSRLHLSVEPASGSSVVVTDLGSSNGTTQAGRPLDAPVTLEPGQSVEFGSYGFVATEITAAGDGAARPATPAGTTPSRITMVGAGLESGGTTGGAVKPVDASPDVRGTSIDLVASQVSVDRDSKAELEALEARTGGTLTFAFSDIESSTELAEAMGDTRWYEALTTHNTIIEGLVDDHGGNIIKSVGDGFMITFPGATTAARCAAAIQKAITEHAREHPELAIKVRMGLHTGEAIEAGGDLFGTHVNMAARVANLAAGEEIMVSSLTRAIAQAAGDLRFDEEREVELKGLAGTHRVSLLIWR